VKRLTALILLVGVAGLSHAGLRAELVAANLKLDHAMKVKDAKGLESAMKAGVTSDFKFLQAGQTQDFKTFIGNLKASIVMMDKINSVTSRILSLKEKGDKASGEVEHVIVATMKTPDKKSHTTKWIGVFTEDYRKVGGKWKTYKMTAVSQKYLVDGKPTKM